MSAIREQRAPELKLRAQHRPDERVAILLYRCTWKDHETLISFSTSGMPYQTPLAASSLPFDWLGVWRELLRPSVHLPLQICQLLLISTESYKLQALFPRYALHVPQYCPRRRAQARWPQAVGKNSREHTGPRLQTSGKQNSDSWPQYFKREGT